MVQVQAITLVPDPETLRTVVMLVKTVLFRPYVFAFLLIYIVAATLKVGFKKTLLFTLSAWGIAYAAEYSSIRNGIPFGIYHYIPSTTDKELWLSGVPFMDSLSFTFLSYTGWTMARLFLSPSTGAGRTFRFAHEGGRFSWRVIMLGALLFMLIDMVIDPLALRGDRWFLGKIYYYPEPGMYFGVTVANFIGWFIVGAATLCVWRFIDGRVKDVNPHPPTPLSHARARGNTVIVHLGRGEYVDLMGPALYYTVLAFNLIMTFWIGEYALGFTGVLLFLPVSVIFWKRVNPPVVTPHPTLSREERDL